jgi:hypothetical protein
VVNPDGLSLAELGAIRDLQRRLPAPAASDPVWERLGERGLRLVKLRESVSASGEPHVRCQELTAIGHAYRTD